MDWGTLVSAVVGGVIVAVGAELAERRRFRNERTLRRDERHAELQYASLTALQEAFLDMVRVSDDVILNDYAAREQKDEERLREIARKRVELGSAHWDAMWKVKVLRERVGDAELREKVWEGETLSRELATSTPADRVGWGDPGARRRMLDRLEGVNSRLGKAIREYERVATGTEPSALRRQWDRLRGWVRRDKKAESPGEGEE